MSHSRRSSPIAAAPASPCTEIPRGEVQAPGTEAAATNPTEAAAINPTEAAATNPTTAATTSTSEHGSKILSCLKGLIWLPRKILSISMLPFGVACDLLFPAPNSWCRRLLYFDDDRSYTTSDILKIMNHFFFFNIAIYVLERVVAAACCYKDIEFEAGTSNFQFLPFIVFIFLVLSEHCVPSEADSIAMENRLIFSNVVPTSIMILNLSSLSSIWTIVCTTHLELMLLPWLLPSYVAFILLLVKKSIVWRWKAKYIYNRFRGRLLIVGFQLYFLSRVNYRSKSKYNRGLAGSAIPISGRNEESPIRQLLKSPHHRDYLAEICPIVSFLTEVPLSKLDFHNQIQCIFQPNSPGNNIASVEYVTEEALQQRLGVEYSAEDAQLLLQQLQADLGTTNITYEAFRKGLVAANEDCLSLRHTLDNAFKVEAILNRVLTGILLLVISIFWVCLQTPFGGFMIRGVLKLKTAVIGPAIVISLITYLNKEWIDGLFFLFVVHPFDIGDRCMIEDKEVEIIEMNVLKTTCKNIDTEEEMTYKNSDLRDRIICKVLEQELKPADKIELVLDASNSTDIESLLKEAIEGLFSKYTHVLQIKELSFDPVGGSKSKMSVHFDHAKNYHEYMNPTKSFQGKKTRHSELDKEIRKILAELDIKVAEQSPVLLSSVDRLNFVL